MGQSKIDNYTDFYYVFFRNVLLVLFSVTIIIGLILSIPHSSAADSGSGNTSSSDSFTVSISDACTLSSVVGSAHTANVNAGTYTSDIGITKISTFCNDMNGYSIYAVGAGNGAVGNTDLVSSINDNYNIHTGIYDSSSIGPNTTSSWSMKLTAGTGTGNVLTPPTIMNSYNNYNVIPSTYTLVAKRQSATDMDLNTDITGSYFTTTYDIYASSIQTSGTYTGTVKYLMMHPSSNLSTIPDINTALAINGKQKAFQDESGSYYAMQDMNSDICALVPNTGESTATQLVDIRDNKLYWVTKLADGKCWMTQNLDLDIDSTKTYTHDDTDLGWDTNSFDTNTTWTPDTINGRYNLPINGTSVPDWSNQSNYPYSADPGDVYYYTSNSTSDDIKYTPLSDCTSAGHTAGECKHYHAGNYYNWTAAIASNNSSNLTTQYVNAPNSICPAGWRLPIATNADQSIYEFGELLYKQGIITTKTSTSYLENGFINIRKSPLWFVRGGSIYNNKLNSLNTYGNYWSGVTIKNDVSYRVGFDKNTVTPAAIDGSRYAGRTLRCLVR